MNVDAGVVVPVLAHICMVCLRMLVWCACVKHVSCIHGVRVCNMYGVRVCNVHGVRVCVSARVLPHVSNMYRVQQVSCEEEDTCMSYEEEDACMCQTCIV